MIALFAFALATQLTSTQAAAEMADIRAHFSAMGKPAAVQRLAALVDQAPEVQSAEAAVWLGDLWRRDSKQRALDYYRHAYVVHATPYTHLLAARGLGDVAVFDGNFHRAELYYQEALPAATGVLAAELTQKRTLAHTLFVRRMIEWLTWLIVLGVLVRFLVGAWERRALSLPSELVYVVPIYLVLIVGAVGRDANVMHALMLCAGVSLALITAAGWAAAGVRRPTVDVLLLVAANAALFYAVLNRMQLIDHLVFTVQL